MPSERSSRATRTLFSRRADVKMDNQGSYRATARSNIETQTLKSIDELNAVIKSWGDLKHG